MMVPGAVGAAGPDAGVPGHYGEPSAEQRALARAAVVDRSHRGVVTVSGADRRDWLHALTSQDVLALPTGVPTETLVLSPHGHVEHHAEIVDDGERMWLLTEGAFAAPLAAWLDGMRFMSRVEVLDRSAEFATVTVTGTDADRLADAVSTVVVADVAGAAGAAGVAGVAGAAVVVRRRRRWPVGALDLLVARAAVDAALDAAVAAGAVRSGHDAFEAARIAAGVARLGMDTDHRTLVHEVGWLAPAVALDKGCYRGQETVARVHNLGRPPRRLMLVHLDGSEHLLPAPGGALTDADGRSVGTLTSVARHFELGPIGLAVLRRSVAEDATLITADGVAAAVADDLSSPTEPVDLSGLR